MIAHLSGRAKITEAGPRYLLNLKYREKARKRRSDRMVPKSAQSCTVSVGIAPTLYNYKFVSISRPSGFEPSSRILFHSRLSVADFFGSLRFSQKKSDQMADIVVVGSLMIDLVR
jgi:hypothetical protein